MHSGRKSMIGGVYSSNNNRIELNFHRNPLNNRLSRSNSNRHGDFKPPKFQPFTPTNTFVKSPLKVSPLASPSATSIGETNGSKIFLEPINPFSPTKSPIRSLGTRSCVSEFAPVRQFEPEKLPKITPESFVGDIPRVNLSQTAAISNNRNNRRSIYGQRNSLRNFSTNSFASRTNEQPFKFVPMPMNLNFTTHQFDEENGDYKSSNNPFQTSNSMDRPLSRASDASNISVNSAISSRMMNVDDESDEKKRRLLQAIRMKDRRRSDLRETSSMCTNLSRFADEYEQSSTSSTVNSRLKRKRDLENSRDFEPNNNDIECDVDEDEHAKQELNFIFKNSSKRKPIERTNRFKNNEILSSSNLIVNKSEPTASYPVQPEPTNSVFKVPSVTLRSPTSNRGDVLISNNNNNINNNNNQASLRNTSQLTTQSVESRPINFAKNNNLNHSTEQADLNTSHNDSNGNSSSIGGGLLAAISSPFNLFRRK